MTVADAEAVAALTREVGYQAADAHIAERCERISRMPDRMLFVAQHGEDGDGEIVGWADVHGVLPLHTTAYAAIVAVVVRASLRRAGIGKALLGSCRMWAQTHGFGDLRLP
ncbi:MAG TPA: GNAT family N-acetyltransferase [Albitalea sp.]|nr:GNAT family N-acetyltransferase [Albitalea sp.]